MREKRLRFRQADTPWNFVLMWPWLFHNRPDILDFEALDVSGGGKFLLG